MEETSSSTDERSQTKRKKYKKRRAKEGKESSVTVSDPVLKKTGKTRRRGGKLPKTPPPPPASAPPRVLRLPPPKWLTPLPPLPMDPDEMENPNSRRLSSFDMEPSDYSMQHLEHTSADALDVELKNVLIRDSLASTTTKQSKKSQRRKLDLLELARTEAEVIEIMRQLGDEHSDPEDEVTCCWSRRAKEKTALKDFGESEEEEGYKVSKDEVLMSRTQRIAKWLTIFGVATVDFFIAAQDTYTILLRKMQVEYLFMAQIYNCEALIGEGDWWLMWANMLHAVASVGLLFMDDLSTSAFGIYWLVSQTLRSFLMMFEAFFRARFKTSFALTFMSFLWWRVPLDIAQMGIVMFRYYKLNNPFPQRLKTLATEIHLDRPLNNELRLRDSTFLQSKFRLREAAAFQTLEIIRKVKKKGKESRMRNRFEIIRTEIGKAFNVLTNPKRYPMKQTAAQAKLKKEKWDDGDGVTIFPNESAAETGL